MTHYIPLLRMSWQNRPLNHIVDTFGNYMTSRLILSPTEVLSSSLSLLGISSNHWIFKGIGLQHAYLVRRVNRTGESNTGTILGDILRLPIGRLASIAPLGEIRVQQY
jgi:hypothetical protein